MSFLVKKSSFLLASTIFASSTLLVECGGGSDGNSTSSQTQPVPTDPVSPTQPTTPTGPINQDILAETSTLPALPVNSLPLSLVGDIDAINALKEGVYTTQLVTVMVFGGGTVDCPSGGSVACPSVTKYQSDTDGKINVTTWAYMPNSKQWIELDSDDGAFNDVFGLGDIYSDGEKWSSTGVDFTKTSGALADNILKYSFGNSEIAVSGISTNINPVNSSIMGGVNYSANAKSISYQIGVTKGQYINLEEAGFWKETDDGGTYSSLAKYRTAHTQKESLLCFRAINWDNGLVFNANQTGATLYKIGSACENKIDPKIPPVSLAEGVKTIAGKQIIYLAQSTNTTSITNNTSESQFLWALGLSDKGIPAQGKAYQAGYITHVNGDFYNQTTVLEWLISKHGYNANLAFPN